MSVTTINPSRTVCSIVQGARDQWIRELIKEGKDGAGDIAVRSALCALFSAAERCGADRPRISRQDFLTWLRHYVGAWKGRCINPQTPGAIDQATVLFRQAVKGVDPTFFDAPPAQVRRPMRPQFVRVYS